MKPIDTKPILVGGFGKIAYGTQYHMGNRVYHSRAVSMGICASPVGNLGGQTYCYLVIERKRNDKHQSSK